MKRMENKTIDENSQGLNLLTIENTSHPETYPERQQRSDDGQRRRVTNYSDGNYHFEVLFHGHHDGNCISFLCPYL